VSTKIGWESHVRATATKAVIVIVEQIVRAEQRHGGGLCGRLETKDSEKWFFALRAKNALLDQRLPLIKKHAYSGDFVDFLMASQRELTVQADDYEMRGRWLLSTLYNFTHVSIAIGL
jgi:hypothetical protein